ncbi:hypothetical protein GOBAR_DD24712 [Gossypium barbadense]|nr:hypothetical protein GOBAR_DD24712 [Gossypium barbadense]
MCFRFSILLTLLLIGAAEEVGFIYNGFRSANLNLDGIAEITSNGLLQLTNKTKQQKGHAFHPHLVDFKNSTNGSVFSFSTTFVFAILPEYPTLSGHGVAFVIAPTKGLPTSLPSQYLGLFNELNNGNDTNHVVAVELDTIRSTEFDDINDNHVGIDINGLTSAKSISAGYYKDGRRAYPVSPSQASSVRTKEKAESFDNWVAFDFGELGSGVSGAVYWVRRKRKFAEVVEDWELEYGPHRFKFKDLYIATKGFKDKELLGAGGFGRVYRGVLSSNKLEVAVKRVSHESRQGMREFVAEIVSIGRLRHRNLVQLLGYCRRKGELLLVYDYMPNGSLDKYLHDQPKVTLNWRQRFGVIKGVASGLLYLHGEWEQVVVHRDVKASNVLLDGELNGRLGDFGLARLYDHGTDPQTTHVVGTLGYLAPEHTRTGKANPSTDVFAFGAFLLEVACGRRPIEAQSTTENAVLVDWVYSCWSKGNIMEAKDPNLGSDYVAEEVELVLKLGLLCSHSEPEVRPTMRQVLQFLEGDVSFPEMSSLSLTSSGLTFGRGQGFDDYVMSYSSSVWKGFSNCSVADSLVSEGR